MLTAHEQARIKELRLKNLSSRAIALRTGHARTTIARVLGQPPKASKVKSSHAKLRRRARPTQVHFSVDYVRCGSCGGLVKPPCLACQIERLKMVNGFVKAA